MVQINLLPLTAREERKVRPEMKLRLRPLIFLLTGLLLSILLVWIMLEIRLSSQGREILRFDEQLKDLGVTLQKSDNLRQDRERLLRNLEFFGRNIKREILWAENLNRLSDLVPAGIWLKNIVLDTKEEDSLHKYVRLDINGSAVSIQGEEMIDLIGRFMAALNKDELFSKQFSEINLLSSKRSKIGNIEIMDFKLLCKFR